MEIKTDVFVNPLTGFGNSLIYQVLPVVFETMPGEVHVVVLPASEPYERSNGQAAITLSNLDEKDV